MNIHEYQAKEILKQFGVLVPKGIVIFDLKEIKKKIKNLDSKNLILKAQIHSGGRGKAGGIKIIESYDNLIEEAKKMFGKVLVTHQTGPAGRKVKRLYLEETSNIKKEFYLSCLVDRSSSKIAFISSAEGGMDIEEVAINNPEKIVTVKMNLSRTVNEKDLNEITLPFALSGKAQEQAFNYFYSSSFTSASRMNLCF